MAQEGQKTPFGGLMEGRMAANTRGPGTAGAGQDGGPGLPSEHLLAAMPEALAIVAVSLIAVAIYVVAWMQARDPANRNPQLERVRLQHQVGWLEERLARAQREGWSPEMVAGIAAERAAVVAELEKASRAG